MTQIYIKSDIKYIFKAKTLMNSKRLYNNYNVITSRVKYLRPAFNAKIFFIDIVVQQSTHSCKTILIRGVIFNSNNRFSISIYLVKSYSQTKLGNICTMNWVHFFLISLTQKRSSMSRKKPQSIRSIWRKSRFSIVLIRRISRIQVKLYL